MKKSVVLLFFVATLSLTSCDFINNLFFSSSESKTTQSTTTISTSSTENAKNQTFYHVFSKDDFDKDGGQTTINGLNFTYDEFTYYSLYWGYGIQIGSSGNPQKNDWNLTCTFNDENVILKSLTMYLTVANNGLGNFKIASNNYENNGIIEIANDPQEFTYSNINDETNFLTISLSSEKNSALYFYSLKFEIDVNDNSTISITDDNKNRTSLKPGEGDIPMTEYELISVDEYYNGVDLTLTGEDLKKELNEKTSNLTKYRYEDAKYILQYTDENPNKPGYMYGLFDGDNIPQNWDGGSSWQREHVWACARMNLTGTARPTESTKNHASDLHNLRVACRGANQYHSDKYYDEEITSNSLYPNLTHDQMTGMHSFNGDHRGDIARILFYMYVTYDGLILTNEKSQMEDDENENYIYSMGVLDMLIKWNNEDKVDEFEKQRNDRIYQYQKNRNPFIDYPNLIEQLFA